MKVEGMKTKKDLERYLWGEKGSVSSRKERNL